MITTRIDVAGNWLGTFQGWNDKGIQWITVANHLSTQMTSRIST
jgi:hypothetical protein